MKIRILVLMLIICTNGKTVSAVSFFGYPFKNDVALEPSGERYWVSANSRIYQLDTDAHQILKCIQMPGTVKLLDICPDGQKIVAGGELIDSSSPAFYELRNIEGGLIASVTGDFTFARPVFSIDSQKFIVIVRNEKKVRIYDCQTGGVLMETHSHDREINSASIQILGSENKCEGLFTLSKYIENGLYYRIVNIWDLKSHTLTRTVGRVGDSTGYYATYYSNPLFSMNGCFLAFTSAIPRLAMASDCWSIYAMISFNSLLGGSFEWFGPSITGFSDDELYFWGISSDNGRIVVQQIDEPQQQWALKRSDGFYALIADLCTIDGKPVMITVFHPNDIKQSAFVILDIETGERISESPPIAEMFQDSNIESWMTHE